MGISVFPIPAAGGIKSVQRGLAGASGNVTITSVNINKSFVNVFGTASTGNVSVSGSVGSAGISSDSQTAGSGTATSRGPAASMSFPGAALTGGTTTLIAGVVQGFLANSTTLTVSGPCRWEVVEFA
jgi:hypothetical protein